MTIMSCEFESHLLHLKRRYIINAEVAQLVEHNLAKVRVAGSNPVFRSKGLNEPLFFFISVFIQLILLFL